MMQMKDVALDLKTQNNRGTSDPIWIVQQKVRDYGYHPDYADNWVYVSSDGFELMECTTIDLSEETADALGYDKCHYTDRWEYVQTFFTEEAAKKFIRTQSHNYNEMRIYVESAHNNPELRKIREHIMSLDR